MASLLASNAIASSAFHGRNAVTFADVILIGDEIPKLQSLRQPQRAAASLAMRFARSIFSGSPALTATPQTRYGASHSFAPNVRPACVPRDPLA